jgi:thiamine biosynthesis lipoprotein
VDRPLTFPALGTTAALVVADDDALEHARTIFAAEIEAIDTACSRFRADSELTRVNAAGGRPVVVSDRFLEALAVALRAARITDGLVDPTVGTAMRTIGYDGDFASIDRDGPPLRVRVGHVPGWHTIETDVLRSTVRLPAGVELDFGATAKALCVDRAAREIGNATNTGVMVSLGGDLAVGGPIRKQGWPVFVTDDHAASPDGAGQRIRIDAGGLATSGTTVRRWVRGDRSLHHVVDPATGLPAHEHWRTASVTAASCVDANIASTAAIVMGADAPRWLEDAHLPARLVRVDGTVTYVAGWPTDHEQADHPC